MYFPVMGGVIRHKVADIKAVDGVSFTLHEGETLGLVGESGCGKSTCGRAIIRLYEPTAGKVIFHQKGKAVDLVPLSRKEMKPHRANIQMIFQDPYSSLNPRMTVGSIIEEPLHIHMPELSKSQMRERVIAIMAKCGLREDQADRYPHEFSGGQRQRVGIARSLATNPSLIIADEPVSALDVSVQAQVINLMQDIQEEFGLTYIFIAHDLSVVKHISTRIAVMYLGNIVEIGNTDDVYFRPIHPYTKALISAVPQILKDKTDRQILEGDVPTPMNKPSGCGFRTRCPIAKPECAKDVPQLVDKGDGHFVACPYADL
jgi:oligopeptide/dipeptide ABC transporter ATP-binding protein